MNRSVNVVQQCFIEGRDDATCCENMSDCILCYPSCMWRAYDDRGNVTGSYTNCMDGGLCESGVDIFPGKCCIIAGGGLGYVIASLVAVPFLFCGSIIKSSILCCDTAAKTHNDDIQTMIKQQPVKYRIVELEHQLSGLKSDIAADETDILELKAAYAIIEGKIDAVPHIDLTGPAGFVEEIRQVYMDRCELDSRYTFNQIVSRTNHMGRLVYEKLAIERELGGLMEIVKN